MTAPELRPHQVALVEGLDRSWQQGHRNVVLQLPTGGGKGTIAAWLAARQLERAGAAPRPGTIVVVSHLDIINRDLRDRLLAAGCPSVRLHGERDQDPDAAVVVVSAQAIDAGDLTFPDATDVIVDEGHREGAASYERFVARHQHARVTLFTATPARADGKGLPHVTAIVQGPQVRELVALGLLAPITVLAPAEPGQTLARDPVGVIPAGRPAIVFASSVPHSVKIADQLRVRRRVLAAHVDGRQSAETRAGYLEAFRTGECQVLCCYRLLAEGVDVPNAEVCVLASRVSSTVTFLQTIGRVRRARPGKTALLVDLCGSVHLHGLPDEDRTYHLDGQAIRVVERDPTEAAVCCRECLAWGPPRSVCEVCGATRPPPKPPRIRAKDLVEQRARDAVDQKRQALERFVADAVRRGQSPWSAAHRWKGTYGHMPPRAWMLDIIKPGRAAS